MRADEMKREMLRLIQDFEQCKTRLENEFLDKIKKSPEFVKLFTDLQQLMQDPVFFEVLLAEGFKKESKVGAPTTWDLSSSLRPLISIFYRISSLSPSTYQIETDVRKYTILESKEKEWGGVIGGIDTHLANWLEKNSKELFLGVFQYDLREQSKKNQYDEMINKLRLSSDKTTALARICNGVFTESVLFIKESGTVQVLVATNSDGFPSHIHSFTGELVQKYNMTLTACPNMKVIHDGNCTVHSELNINTVLCEALQHNNSVYNVLDKLRNNQLKLDDFRVEFTSLAPINTSTDIPDSSTLARYLSTLAMVCQLLGCAGWIEYCRAKKFTRFILSRVTTLIGPAFSTLNCYLKKDLFP